LVGFTFRPGDGWSAAKARAAARSTAAQLDRAAVRSRLGLGPKSQHADVPLLDPAGPTFRHSIPFRCIHSITHLSSENSVRRPRVQRNRPLLTRRCHHIAATERACPTRLNYSTCNVFLFGTGWTRVLSAGRHDCEGFCLWTDHPAALRREPPRAGYGVADAGPELDAQLVGTSRASHISEGIGQSVTNTIQYISRDQLAPPEHRHPGRSLQD